MVVAVLNYTTGDVIVKPVPKELEHIDDGNELIEKMGYNTNSVSYMFVDDSMDIFVRSENLSQVITVK